MSPLRLCLSRIYLPFSLMDSWTYSLLRYDFPTPTLLPVSYDVAKDAGERFTTPRISH